MTSHLSNVWFSVTPLQVASGKGCWVTTTDGEEYLDFAAGIAVNSTGHAHPHVAKAIGEQAQRFIHAQVNVYKHDLLEPLAAKLAELSPPSIDTFFYANSGAEITEASIKLAKQVTKRPHTIVFSGSFHGRTHMAMAMTTSKTGYRAGHFALPAGVFVAPYPDPLAEDQDAAVAEALKGFDHLLKSMTAPEETAAVILEPVLGEGGYIPAPQAFMTGLVERCRQHGIMFVADEVQSGMGRTGKMFAIEHFGVEPDILATAKGIASGMPLGVCTARADVMSWPPGAHASTFGGNPVSCAAALATIDLLRRELVKNAEVVGAYLLESLASLKDKHPLIGDVRGKGLMVGIECVKDRTTKERAVDERDAIVDAAFTRGLLVLGAGKNTIRLSPPLVLSKDQADTAVRILDEAFTDVEKARGYRKGGG